MFICANIIWNHTFCITTQNEWNFSSPSPEISRKYVNHNNRVIVPTSLAFNDFFVRLSPYKTNFSNSCENTSNCVDVWVICKGSRSSLKCTKQPNYASCISISAFQNGRGIYYQFFSTDISSIGFLEFTGIWNFKKWEMLKRSFYELRYEHTLNNNSSYTILMT